MHVGLFFGSFNPIHIGHLAIANYMAGFTQLDEVWLVVSPQNPFKQSNELAPSEKRFHLVERAVENSPGLRASGIELELAAPSYTVETLKVLEQRYPGTRFFIVMGADGLSSFKEWKESDFLIANYERLIYPRPGVLVANHELKNAQMVAAPLIEISSTFIRQAIRAGKDVRHFVPIHLWEEIRLLYS